MPASSLRSPSPEQRYQAIAQLAEGLHREAAPALLPLLRDPDEKVCCAAAVALAELGGPECLEPLTESALYDESLAVRERAIWALGYRADPASLPVLRQLRQQDSPLRRAAARALNLADGTPLEPLPLTEHELSLEARDRAEIPSLLDILRTSDDPDQRRLAAESLSQIAHTAGRFPELLEPFLGLLENEPEEIAYCAVAGLEAQSPKNPPLATHLLVSALPRFPALAVVAGHWQIAQAAPVLRDLAKSADRFQSAPAVEALARLGDPDSQSLLAKTLAQSNAPAATRMLAAQALGRQAGPEALAALKKALSSCKVDQDGEVLIAVVRALAAPALAQLTPALLDLYARVSPSRIKRKPSDFLARHDFLEYYYNLAREVLLALKGSSLPVAQALLRQELQSPHAALRRQAADSLSVLGAS